MKIMLIDKFNLIFKDYCQCEFPLDTGTAGSYAKAIKYFFEFMEYSEITSDLILEIKKLESDIRNTNSDLYKQLDLFYTSTRRQSYLRKGFLQAALPVLFKFSSTSKFKEAN